MKLRNNRAMKLALILAVLAALAGAASARSMHGTVTHVTDGDTVWLQPDDLSAPAVKLRLQGIDAPEICQPWGPQARAALEARVLRRHVQVDTRATDDYGRRVAKLHLATEDVGAWMVAQGHAWSYRYRRSAGPYAAEEQQARAARRGLFADARAVEPRLFRRQHGACMH